MKKTIGIIIALVVVVGIVFMLKNKNTSEVKTDVNTNINTITETEKENTTTTKSTTTPTNSKIAGYTMSDVSTHATSSSCWTAVNGSVYDVTSWVNQHPGGARAILGMCGKDASSAFNGQHGGQSRPESELASFKIGILN
ncbi:MAG: cytochrome b5 domain-containing protein [Minisyncoccia bacterium]